MRKRISVEDLRPGMYLDGIDKSWFKTPFLTHSFHIRTLDQIQQIKDAEITHVFVDEELDESESFEPETSLSQDMPLEMTAEPVERTLTPDELNTYSRQKENLLQIDKKTLLKGSVIDFSLYRKDDIDISLLTKYNKHDVEVTDEILAVGGEILIALKDISRYRDYLKQLAVHTSSDRDAQRIKNAIIKENTKMVVKEMLIDPRSGNTVELCQGAVEDIISSIHDSGGMMSSILTLNKYDYYTYAHSVEVSVLTLGLAMSLGMDRERDLMPLGVGSLLHDIGKSEIPPVILNKPGKLTEDEFRIMKQHVQKGAKLLRTKRDIKQESFYPVIEHHEKLSGIGYPFGVKGEAIHISGRITAIADTYDAITTARPYQATMSPYKALSIIQNQPENYDMELLRAFVKMLGSNLDDIRKNVEATKI